MSERSLPGKNLVITLFIIVACVVCVLTAILL